MIRPASAPFLHVGSWTEASHQVRGPGGTMGTGSDGTDRVRTPFGTSNANGRGTCKAKSIPKYASRMLVEKSFADILTHLHCAGRSHYRGPTALALDCLRHRTISWRGMQRIPTRVCAHMVPLGMIIPLFGQSPSKKVAFLVPLYPSIKVPQVPRTDGTGTGCGDPGTGTGYAHMHPNDLAQWGTMYPGTWLCTWIPGTILYPNLFPPF